MAEQFTDAELLGCVCGVGDSVARSILVHPCAGKCLGGGCISASVGGWSGSPQQTHSAHCPPSTTP
eukprot:3342832-Prorocentrum_lima.AAC.1